MRQRLDALGTSDEEVAARRWIVGKEDIDAMRATRAPSNISTLRQPLVNLLRA